MQSVKMREARSRGGALNWAPSRAAADSVPAEAAAGGGRDIFLVFSLFITEEELKMLKKLIILITGKLEECSFIVTTNSVFIVEEISLKLHHT